MKKATATAAAGTAVMAGKAGKGDAVSLLKADHRKVEQLFAQFESAEEDAEKQKLVKQICTELIVHTKLEEEIFYPACREKQVEDDLMDEAQVEHDGAKVLIGDLLSAKPDDEFYDAKVKTLSEYITHHVGEEEMPRSGVFAKAQKAGVDMAGLGTKLQARKTELMGEGEALTSQPPQPRSFKLSPQPQENASMANQYSNRDRDDRGRFSIDDDNGLGSYQSRSNYGRSSRDDDDRGYSSQSRGGDRDRDSQGRFTSDDDNRSSQSRGRSNYDDDNRSSRSGEGRGWYGDSQGHSQAAREGWDDRGSSRSSRSRDDDDRGYSSQSRGSSRDRDEQGRFTSDDDRGGSQSRGGRSSYDDDNRGGSRSGGGHGGWFGDSQGHSQAAREGWEDRGSSRSSHSRDDDDDRGSRSGGRGGNHSGHGGWFGDAEGHAQAAREGWRNR